ncbi:YeiH family protein [Helicobacter ailurogastricus]|uniref:Putative membrane protein YeiH n=1 Tax=Helicobacter ailurogastricus TaxID=1578720 RepID=A0A0K2Y6D7_9HELI|nr:putative sulfate exporter family transporter [Helicobacter ailurogastricus]CRF52720.1 Putative membrane protein YeiH [Helicobacter ailurogastricus]
MRHHQNLALGTLLGLCVISGLAFMSLQIAHLPFLTTHHISPLLVAVLLGLLGSFIYPKIAQWIHYGVHFSAKKLLRLGIILYGFNVTINDILHYGYTPLFIALVVVVGVFLLGVWLGGKMGLDRDLSMLVACGSAVCGAAAVLALESVLKSPPFKGVVAVGTVIVFGLVAMFAYPFVYHLGLVPLSPLSEGVYIGATLHEVANVAGAASGISLEAEKVAVTIKMVRVIMLIPLLLAVSFYLKSTNTAHKHKVKLQVPWFAFIFLGMVVVHSYLQPLLGGFVPPDTLKHGVEILRFGSVVCLVCAMGALGLQVELKKFLSLGGRAFGLALVLFVVLVFGGFGLVKVLAG